MKKILTLFITLLSIHFANAQFHNDGFEFWEEYTVYSEPVYKDTNATTLNRYFSLFGDPVVSKVMLSENNYGMKLTNASIVLQDTNSSKGYALFGDFNTSDYDAAPLRIRKPNAILIDIEYSIPGIDSAMIFIVASLDTIGNSAIPFKYKFAGEQKEMKTMKIDLSNTYFPYLNFDSIAYYITSGNVENDSLLDTRNYIIVDNIRFANTTDTVLFPNGDFEEWNDYTNVAYDTWSTSNFYIPYSVIPNENSTEGNYSIELTTTLDDDGDTNNAWALIGEFREEDEIGPGLKLEGIPVAISFDAMYSSVETDSGVVGAIFTKFDNIKQKTVVVGITGTKLSNLDGFTHFEIPVLNNIITPDSVAIFLNSSDDEDGIPIPGSKLIVDNFKIIYDTPVGTKNVTNSEINVYPNPSNGVINIADLTAGDLVSIIASDGKLISSHTAQLNSISLNLSQGIYTILVNEKAKQIIIE